MGAAGADRTVFDNRDPIRAAYRSDALRNDYFRRIGISLLQRTLEIGLGLEIERAGRIAKDKYFRALQNRPGDGYALLLTARQAHAPLGDGRIISVRSRFDKFGRLRGTRRHL